MNKGTRSCLGCLGIVFGSLLVLFLGLYVYYEWIWEEWPVERIERITGVKVPEFRIIERHEGKRHFTGDYLDTLIIEFESIPSDELFEEIDRMIASNDTKWEKSDSVYSYFTFWGNGIPAPEGESEADDAIFKITLTKGSKYGEIEDGAWMPEGQVADISNGASEGMKMKGKVRINPQEKERDGRGKERYRYKEKNRTIEEKNGNLIIIVFLV